MIARKALAAALSGVLLSAAVSAREGGVSTTYKALKCAPGASGVTWAVLDRNGANAKVQPYLSSLAQGEAGTGVVSSPEFAVEVDRIAFTVCGHDGQGGGRGENFVALVDARSGKVLMKTPAPGADGMQERSWDVSGLKGRRVRIDVNDGIGSAGYAWLGVGRVDAGPSMTVDFRAGKLAGWRLPGQDDEGPRSEVVSGAVPFLREVGAPGLIPRSGSVEMRLGFAAKRLFLLGCTVDGGKPLETYGCVEVHYASGSPDVFPLTCGFTLQAKGERLRMTRATYLHRSGDRDQYYIAIAPRAETIKQIRFVAGAQGAPIPLVTAITCETTAQSPALDPLPDTTQSAREAAWIAAHSVAPGEPDLGRVVADIREAYGLPAPRTSVSFRKHVLDPVFRSEGVAVADLDGDGRLDICAGNVYYAGPDWKMRPMLGRPRDFNRLGYSDAFLCFADDVDRDGATDMIVVGFPGQKTRWLRNPGRGEGNWTEHLAVERTGNESPDFVDVDGDKRGELVFINGSQCSLARPGDDPTRPWVVSAIAAPGEPGPGHGLGVGDVNGDGRTDVLVPEGWWEGPAERGRSPWRFHRTGFYGGAQLCVSDLDGDGDADVLGSSAHGFGISWCEQTPGGWRTHEIDRYVSQTHALHLADINGDGLVDFVTGKRFWAHNGHDTGSYGLSSLSWYELSREGGRPRWTRHDIDYESGVGLHFRIVDVNGDGLLDIVTSNKKGVYFFEQARR